MRHICIQIFVLNFFTGSLLTFTAGAALNILIAAANATGLALFAVLETILLAAKVAREEGTKRIIVCVLDERNKDTMWKSCKRTQRICVLCFGSVPRTVKLLCLVGF
jgi:hypothetical protein